MRAGSLRHRVSVEHFTSTQNEYGEPVETWSEFLEIWAAREDLTGREYFSSQQVNAEVTTRFRTRYVPGLSAKMRLNDAGTFYEILSVQDPDGRNSSLILLTKRLG